MNRRDVSDPDSGREGYKRTLCVLQASGGSRSTKENPVESFIWTMVPIGQWTMTWWVSGTPGLWGVHMPSCSSLMLPDDTGKPESIARDLDVTG